MHGADDITTPNYPTQVISLVSNKLVLMFTAIDVSAQPA